MRGVVALNPGGDLKGHLIAARDTLSQTDYAKFAAQLRPNRAFSSRHAMPSPFKAACTEARCATRA